MPAATAIAASGISFPAVIGYAKEFDGVELQGASFASTFFEYLKGYFPEFEEQTGMKVNFVTNAFPVYNQRTDLELSTQGSAPSTSSMSPSSIPAAGSAPAGSRTSSPISRIPT